MADYNTAALIDTVIAQSKDSSFSRDLVLEYIQRTQDEVLGRSRFKFNEDSLESIVSDGSVTFEYDCDHQEIIQLILIDESTDTPTIYQPLYLSPNEFYDIYPDPSSNRSGVPSNYTDYNGELVFSIPFDRDLTVKMRYVERPKLLTDATTSKTQIPIEYKNILIKGGLAGIEQFRENFDIAALHERKVEDLADDMLGRYGLRKMGPGKARTRGLSYGNTPTYPGITRGPF